MKHILFIFLLVALSSVAAPWQYKIDANLTPQDAQNISAGKLSPEGWATCEMPHYCLDLDDVAAKKMPLESVAILTTEITSDNDITLLAGTGCDWWIAVYVNGQEVFSSLKSGNVHANYSPTGHFFTIPLKKGKNTIALYTIRGSVSWQLSFATFMDAQLLPTDKNDIKLFAGKLVGAKTKNAITASSPWQTRVTPTSAKIGIVFDVPVAAAIRYVPKGETKGIKEVWLTCNGLRKKQEIHRFDLTGLQPDTEYNYVIVALNETIPQTVDICSGEFKTNPASGVNQTFYALSDTQMPQEKRIAAVKDMIHNCSIGKGDFIVSLGDMDSFFDNFREIYLTSFFEVLEKNGVRPQAHIIRGNHEYRGNQSDYFYDYFGTGYYAFRYGDVFYIALDTFEDQPVSGRIPQHFSLRNKLPEYIAQEAEWFEQVINSDACKTAKKRIILAHATPFEFENGFYFKNINAVVGKYIFGENPLCKIDLWLCGDTHCPYRFDPVTGKLFGASRSFLPREDKKLRELNPKQITFPVYVNDGPGYAGINLTVTKVQITDDAIRLTQMALDGSIQDDVTFTPGKPVIVHSTKFVDYASCLP